jgi:hypothetical protein
MTEETRPPQTKETNWLTLVQQHVRSLRYGVVQIVVHEGRVTQVEKTEKTRLDQSSQATKG